MAQWLKKKKKKSACNAGDAGSIPGQEDPMRRNWQPTPVFLPEKSHGQRSLTSSNPWGRKESDMTEQLSTHAHLQSCYTGDTIYIALYRVPKRSDLTKEA